MSVDALESAKNDYLAAYEKGQRISIGAYFFVAIVLVIFENQLPSWVFSESGMYLVIILSALALLACINYLPGKYAAVVVRWKCRKTGHAMKEYATGSGGKVLICERCGDKSY